MLNIQKVVERHNFQWRLQYNDTANFRDLASAQAGGFSDADRAELRFLAQLLASQLEVVVQRHVATTLLRPIPQRGPGVLVNAAMAKPYMPRFFQFLP